MLAIAVQAGAKGVARRLVTPRRLGSSDLAFGVGCVQQVLRLNVNANVNVKINDNVKGFRLRRVTFVVAKVTKTVRAGRTPMR